MQEITLKELREQCGKSRNEIATALEVTPNAITNYESGIRQIDIAQVLVLAELFDCSAEEVIRAQLQSILVHDTE